MSSMPAKIFLAARNDLKLSIGFVTRLMARWSCSTMLLGSEVQWNEKPG